MRTYSLPNRIAPLPRITATHRRAGVGLLAAITSVALLQTRAPPAAAHTVSAAAATPAGTSYTIKKGDTLSGIALKHKVTVSQVVAVNGLKDQHFIVAGKTIVIPTGVPQTSITTAAPKAAVTTSRTFNFPDQGGSPGQAPPASLRARGTYSALDSQFNRAATKYGVSAEVLKSLSWQESGWNNAMVSHTGAVGVGQLMPDTVAFVNEVLIPGKALDPKDSAQNIEMSAAFYRYLLRENKGDHRMALASYYQGLASVRRIGLLPETQQYVRSVVAVQGRWF